MKFEAEQDWLVACRVKWDASLELDELAIRMPEGAEFWRFGPEGAPLDENGFPIFASSAWGGFMVYKDRQQAAERAASARDLFQNFGSVTEIWSALLMPISFRGQVNWRGQVESSPVLVCADKDPQPDGRLVVITSAGFDSQEPAEFPRIARFTQGSKEVLSDFKKIKGCMVGSIFYAMHDGMDGITFTIWQNSDVMHRAAYGDSLHGDFLREHRHTPMMDRFSSTHARLVNEYGSWDGVDLSQNV